MNIDWSKMKTAAELLQEARRAAVPATISRSQGRAILTLQGLMPAVLAYVAALTDAEEAMWADLALNHTNTWHRHGSPFLEQAAATLALTEDMLDELFIAAAAITI